MTMRILSILTLVGFTGAAFAQPKPDKKADAKPAAEKPDKKEEKKAAAAPLGSKHPDFDKLVKEWDDAKAAGKLDAGTAKSLAKSFSSHAKGDTAAIAHFNAGTLWETAGDSKAAEGEYQDALKANPNYWPAINNLGEMAYRTGQRDKARDQFQHAIKVDQAHASGAYNNLAMLLVGDARNTGNAKLLDDALSNLRRALAIDAKSMPAYALMALVFYYKSETDRAKLAIADLICRNATDITKTYAPIYNTWGLIKLRKKNVTGALRDFEKAVELDPAFIEAHLNIGAIGLSSRQYAKAQTSFDAVLKLQPTNFDAQVGVGVALRGQKKIPEAEAAYKKAGQLDPKNCSIPYNLGLLYQDYIAKEENANLREAQEFYRQYQKCGKTSPKKLEDATRRIKDIDDTFVAIAEAKKLEAEAAKIKEEADRQIKAAQEQEAAQKAKLDQERAAKEAADKDKAPKPDGAKKDANPAPPPAK
jgi:superkiller protein 3